MPVLLLKQTSEQPGVLRVNQIQPPGETQGNPMVTGQGSAVHGSGAWNDAGYTGQGIKVGVIDTGFSGIQEILGAEVPRVVRARCYTWLGEHTGNLADCGGGTHGINVSESLMDIAPGATLYISDPQSLSELRNAVDWMISEGVSVINHSRLWSFDGPGDGTSPLSVSPLNAIDSAVAAGVVWVNAVGNQAQGTWFRRGPFDYTTETIDGEEISFLRFSGSEVRNRDSYIGGRLELRWDDSWRGADTDLDLFALTPGTDTISLQSTDLQSGEAWHYPIEWVRSASNFDILIAHRGGPEPDWIQLAGWGPTRLTLNSSGTGSVINPAESANPGMLAVGAAPWNDVNILSTFSSQGPTPDGRIKPEGVAANCGDTATSTRPFCGTSQASPHVAGMAALVRQRFPSYTPAQVVSYLKNEAAQRISSPDPNNTWGHGFFVFPPVAQSPQPSATVPGMPGNLIATGNGQTRIDLTWGAPSTDGGAPITGYQIEVSTNRSSWSSLVSNTGSTGASYSHTSLTAGSTRYYRVSAINSVGAGFSSNIAEGSTDAAYAPDPVVDRFTVSESAPKAGASFTLNATVHNQGSGSSGFTRLHFYQSTDSTIPPGDRLLGTNGVPGLTPSGSEKESFNVTAPSTPRTYYYGACADEVSTETNTANNCSSTVAVSIGAAPAPDLVVDAPTVSASAPAAEARFTLNATVRNQGNGQSDSTTLRYYQSADSTITTGDTGMGTDSVSGLIASASGVESIGLTASSTPGTYYYGACVDAVTGEADTTNNCSSAVAVTIGGAPAPDLVVESIEVDNNTPFGGTTFTITAGVRNRGGVSSPTTRRYYQSADSTISTNDTQVGTNRVSGLMTGGLSETPISLTAPSSPGTYYYGACVDPVPNESNANDNCSTTVTVTVTVPQPNRPDLILSSATVSDPTPDAGSSFTLEVQVRNRGDGASASVTLSYYQSADATITTGDTQMGTDSVSRLDASKSGAESVSLTAPSTPGTYYYGACVDAVSEESNTANNCSSNVTVIVSAATAPDLTVDTPTVDDSTLETGDSFTLSATVRNQDDGSAGSTTLRYYRSSDSTITTSDTEVRTDSVSGLSASGTSDESVSLTVPSSAGTYYYGACVGSVSDESDTTNNCSSAVTVTVAADQETDPTPAPRPAGKGVTGEVISCTGEQVTPGIDSYRITIAGA